LEKSLPISAGSFFVVYPAELLRAPICHRIFVENSVLGASVKTCGQL